MDPRNPPSPTAIKATPLEYALNSNSENLRDRLDGVECTLEQFLQLPDHFGNYELASGVLRAMAPPCELHVRIQERLKSRIHHHAAFTGLRVNATSGGGIVSGRDTERIPDIIVRENNNLKLIVEITSPSTRIIDLTVKVKDYRKTGVDEYWILDLQGDDSALIVYTNPGWKKTEYKRDFTHLLIGAVNVVDLYNPSNPGSPARRQEKRLRDEKCRTTDLEKRLREEKCRAEDLEKRLLEEKRELEMLRKHVEELKRAQGRSSSGSPTKKKVKWRKN